MLFFRAIFAQHVFQMSFQTNLYNENDKSLNMGGVIKITFHFKSDNIIIMNCHKTPLNVPSVACMATVSIDACPNTSAD